jgi:hypothetical protein
MDSSLLAAVGTSLLTHFPVFLVWLAGAIVALIRPTLPRRVVGFLVGGLAAHFVLSVAGTAVSIMLPMRLMQGGATHAAVGVYLAVWGIVLSVVSAAAWVLVLLAVFTGREATKG